jgi:hypothetical protein
MRVSLDPVVRGLCVSMCRANHVERARVCLMFLLSPSSFCFAIGFVLGVG